MNPQIRYPIISIVLICALILCGCNASSEETTKALPGEDTVLATVNGSEISAYDLQQAVRTSLGEAARGMLDEKGKKSILDSLVAARAISQVQEKNLTATEKAELDAQVAAYREQLLVKIYLAEHTEKEPVSQKMVQDYYDRHRDRFGEKTVKQYELITTTGPVNDKVRDRVLAAMQNPGKQKDWAAWSKKLKQAGLPVDYQSGNADPAILTADLRSRISQLKPESPANLAFANGVISLARVTAEKKIPPRPLEEVSSRIRKTLLPVQLKKAVKQASDKVLDDATVVYMQSGIEKQDK